MRQTSTRIARVLDAAFLVADFALLEDGRLSLVEVNPGHSSGFGHDAALVGAHGRFLRQLAGLHDLSALELAAICARCKIELWGQGKVFDFYVA